MTGFTGMCFTGITGFTGTGITGFTGMYCTLATGTTGTGMMGLWMGFLGAYPYWPGKACAIATQQTTKQINVFIFFWK